MSDLVYTGDMADVEEFCGRDVADQVSDVLSGLNLYVPLEPREGTPVDKLDEEVAAALCAQFGGSLIYISKPRPPKVPTSEVNRLLGQGLTVQQVALKLRVSDRWVRELRDRSIAGPSDPRQLTFFDGDASDESA